jgi:hypothetical protein
MQKVLSKDILLRQTRQSTTNEARSVQLLRPEEEEDTKGKKDLLTSPPVIHTDCKGLNNLNIQ